jgi:hypothetical protein
MDAAHVATVFCFGGLGALVGEGTIILFGVPLYTDIRPGDVLGPWWQAVEDTAAQTPTFGG